MGNIIKWVALPRCPPSRALGHCQREMQPATSAMASDEAKAVLSSCWAGSSSVSLRIIRKCSKTWGREEACRSWPSPSIKLSLSFTPTHTQFFQPLGWTSSPERVAGNRTLLPEATGQKGTENFLGSKLRQEAKLGPGEAGLELQEYNCTTTNTLAH